jgi:hypothetical protein
MAHERLIKGNRFLRSVEFSGPKGGQPQNDPVKNKEKKTRGKKERKTTLWKCLAAAEEPNPGRNLCVAQ